MLRHGRLSCFPPPSTSSLGAGSSQPKARCSAAFLFTHPPLPFRYTALSRIALVHGPLRLLQHSHIRKNISTTKSSTYEPQVSWTHPPIAARFGWLAGAQSRGLGRSVLPIICPVHTTLTTYNYSLSQDFSPLRVAWHRVWRSTYKVSETWETRI